MVHFQINIRLAQAVFQSHDPPPNRRSSRHEPVEGQLASYPNLGPRLVAPSGGCFTGLAAGANHALSVSFDPLLAGLFERVVQINLFGTNGSGFNGGLGTFNVTFKGAVSPSAVPVPAAVWLLGSALFGLMGARRRAA